MSRTLADSVRALEKIAETAPAVLIGYSGGKDSACVLDLCVRVFARVVPYYFYLIRDMDLVERQLAPARERYGLEVLRYPSPSLWQNLKNGIYCVEQPDLRPPSFADLTNLIRHETGIRLVVTGERGNDYAARAARLKGKKVPDTHCPLEHWNKWSVLAYLAARKIPVPESHRDSGGIDLTTRSLLWLHQTSPDDFDKLCRVFPFARSVLRRKEFYGVPSDRPEKA